MRLSILFLLLSGCAFDTSSLYGRDGGRDDGYALGDGGESDSGPENDGGRWDLPDSFVTPSDSGTDSESPEGGTDAGFPDGGTDAFRPDDAPLFPDVFTPASSLDPDLDVPPESNPTCASPGTISGSCGGYSVCRFYDTASNRCESATASGMSGSACSSGNQCDVYSACFRGACAHFCRLGRSDCGGAECLYIGHPVAGICDPS